MARPLFSTDPTVWIYTLPVLLQVCCCRVQAQQSSWPDRDAMFSIRSKLFGNESVARALSIWNLSTPYCDWEGVTCDGQGAVTSLERNLYSQSFAEATLSEEVGSLAELQTLHLNSGTLGGRIPMTITKLRHLRSIDLSSNMFRGPIPSLKGLSNLTILNLSTNQLSGEILDHDWQDLENLEILDLSLNNLTGTISFATENLVNLRIFDLSFNRFQGTIHGLANLTSLVEVYMQSNEFEGTIPSFKKSVNLTLLSLSYNHLMGGIPEWDWGNSAIQGIYLDRNNLSGRLPLAIFKLVNLDTLILSFNNLEGPLPDLGGFANMKDVDLSNNKFTGSIEGWDWNGSWIRENHTLRSLDLSGNQLSGSIPGALLLGLQSLALSLNSFRSLDLTSDFNGRDAPSSPLKDLDLGYNRLEFETPRGGGSPSFPGQFFRGLQFPKLNSLILDENRLSGDISLYLFDLFDGDSFGKFPALTELYCAGNNISGELSLKRGIGTSAQVLEILDLSRNPNLRLSDSTQSGDPSCLQTILLGRRFPFLRELRLSDIHHVGVLPLRVGFLVALEVLDLSHNDLSGVMGIEYNNDTLGSLKYLDLSHNELMGAVPENLTQIDSLYYLDLSYNNFSGQLPTFLKEDDDGVRRLRFNVTSFLGNAGLCGQPLPACPDVHWTTSRPRQTWVLRTLEVVGFSAIAVSSFIILAWRWTVCSKRHPRHPS